MKSTFSCLVVVCLGFLLVAALPRPVAGQTEWVRYPANPILDIGSSSQWDDVHVTSPCVLSDATGYRMWFTGYDGSTWRIGYATSPDEISWTKYAGDPVLNLGSPGQWDDSHVSTCSVLFEGDRFSMWYAGSDGGRWRIGRACSPDGVTWTKYEHNPVLNLGSAGEFDDEYLYNPCVLHEDGVYKMWYTGYDGSHYRIGYATSPDGVSWTKYAHNPVLDLGSPGQWDDYYVWYPNVLHRGSTYEMWYTGQDGYTFRIGYATSVDGVTWTRCPENPVLDLGAPGAWDNAAVVGAWVILEAATYKMWYQGGVTPSGNWRIGYATSEAAPPPPVTITLDPDFTTIRRGETASGTATVTNTTSSRQTFQLWTEITNPYGGTRVGIRPRTYTLKPYQTSVNYLTQLIPPDAALGVYTYCGKVGTYPTPVMDEDCFEFTVTP